MPHISSSHLMCFVILCWATAVLSRNVTSFWNSDNVDVDRNHTEDALQRLLKVFGLEGNIPETPSGSHLPPQYMLDLYTTFADGSVNRKTRTHGANTVRCFLDKGASEDEGHYLFEISNAIPSHEEIVDAEFHLFTHRRETGEQQRGHVMQIQLYEGLRDKLLESRLTSAHTSGWEVFQVTASIKKWITGPEVNLGFSVQVVDSSGKVRLRKKINRQQSYKRPILVVFSSDPKTATHRDSFNQPDHNVKTHIRPNSNVGNRLQELSYEETGTSIHENIINQTEENSPRNTRSTPESNQCARHELRVDFERLGWSMWIISPKWYNAYVCTGTCAFPLGQNQRPTNHATVQSIVHELGLARGVGTPCCVPTELHPVSLLYFDEYMNVVLKQYDDMIAAGCGCQ